MRSSSPDPARADGLAVSSRNLRLSDATGGRGVRVRALESPPLRCRGGEQNSAAGVVAAGRIAAEPLARWSTCRSSTL